jgi:site-specific DNA-methyltransferase (adenine-specific)
MPEPIQLAQNIGLYHADCRETLQQLADNSIDSVVTDPPYALNFMGKSWDTGAIVNDPAFWSEVLRVLKPGGHIAVFGGTRTYHRVTCAIEDAGFEIRDSLMWIYGSGFPKSHDVSKAIDKEAGAEREIVGERKKLQSYGANEVYGDGPDKGGIQIITAPATDAARQWQGWGTALKPAHEPIVLARKPLSEKTVVANVMKWGTGAINVDGCRIPTKDNNFYRMAHYSQHEGWGRPWNSDPGALKRRQDRKDASAEKSAALGRWPANVCHDGSEEVVGVFPQTYTNGNRAGAARYDGTSEATYGKYAPRPAKGQAPDSGSAARFYYSAKASKADRAGSKHPTVKPITLMQWLARLITPPSGTVLDPFAGSGTTGMAAQREGFACVMCEREDEYVEDIKRRFTAVLDSQESPSNQMELWAAPAADV